MRTSFLNRIWVTFDQEKYLIELKDQRWTKSLSHSVLSAKFQTWELAESFLLLFPSGFGKFSFISGFIVSNARISQTYSK